MTNLDHWGNRSKDFLLPHFENAEYIVKIASGFFTVKGFNIFINALEGKKTLILVGYDENQNKNLIGKLLADVKEDLKRWDHLNRYAAVRLLIAKLVKREIYFRENDDNPYADARIRKDDHGKVYIIDDKIVFTGSINSTYRGLVQNEESSAGINEPERVIKWIIWFKERWEDPNTQDLTRLLLELLSAWITFVTPFDIYLKSIGILVPEEDPIPPRADYKLPANYQKVIIKRVIRQLKTYKGAMIVASTGMGKTIMATDVCHRLQNDNLIDNVIIFAPKATHINWENAMYSAGLRSETFSRELLSQKRGTGSKSKHLQRVLKRVDEKNLIIIDESHYFRNEKDQYGNQKTSFERILDAVHNSNCYVILLTATPYAKGYKDINNQLTLMPHTAPTRNKTHTGQMVFGNMGMIDHPNAWRIPETQVFFDEFRNLEVVTLISTSWVAKNFGVHTDKGDYVNRPDSKVWIPNLHLAKINVPLPFEKLLLEGISKNLFKHEWQFVSDRDGGGYQTNEFIERQLRTSWASSPVALQEVIQKTIDDTYGVTFLADSGERIEHLIPINNMLDKITYKDDPKFVALGNVINMHSNDKIIIFTERKATAVYLFEAINEAFISRNVETSVKPTSKPYEYEDNRIQGIIERFAPLSNGLDEAPDNELDILILTDAHSTGINLQDANVVINYDLAWTPDVIIQRAGRIMRFWSEPRVVNIYAFVAVCEYESEYSDLAHKVTSRFRSLSMRSRNAEEITEVPILPEEEQQMITSLGEFNKVTLEDIGQIDAREVEEYSGGSPFLQHFTAYTQNQERADELDDDISSAKLYAGKFHLVYLLLRYKSEYEWLIYNITLNRYEDYSNDELLELIKCEPDEETVPLDSDILEEHAQQMRDEWCNEKDLSEEEREEVERICALYLKPKDEEDSLETMIALGAEKWQ